MLSNDTKKIIDYARDTLVGQIPVPMMQCQQITLALTYKFMSDDDQLAVDLGGQRHYFAGDLEKYAWGNVVSLRLDDTERSELYREGLNALRESESMPAVFREIFKDAVVPFGDHRTLALFLNTMDRMEYDDSEKLGDAYEYLLKIAEAQADAGQFRTPRHIINFIVSIINPQKHEVIIDPACGTAGFLVSAYQHIKNQNRGPNGETTLSAPDLNRLSTNLKGYDISPEMTKLAMANMYLHTQDKDPNIYNYDTLTSTDHWNEYGDVMLANPPFMTPKGGIKPHTLFRVPAKRAEVLFVDYIASHLNEHGRAGIIVPEGIIFQSQKAYKQLKSLLLDESLVAVISLPGGVFNPYSPVKTSILILDKVLAPKTDHIAFFKVEDDGYDLGDQRRPIGKDDLPAVAEEVGEYIRRLRFAEPIGDFAPQTGLVVEKSRITKDGGYNLSGERYRDNEVNTGAFPIVAIGSVCVINPTKKQLADRDPELSVSFVPMADLNENQITFHPRQQRILSEVSGGYTYFEDDDVILAKVTPCFENGKAGIARGLLNGVGFGSTEFYVLRCSDQVLPEWIYFCVTHPEFRNSGVAQMTGTGGLQRVPRHFVQEFEVPLPPLEVQRELVAEIEGYQQVINGARQMAASYQPRIPVDPTWPTVRLPEACDINPETVVPHVTYPNSTIFYADISAVNNGDGKFLGYSEVDSSKAPSRARRRIRQEDILLSTVRPNLKAFTILKEVHERAIASTGFAVLRARAGVAEPRFILASIRSDDAVRQMVGMMEKGSYPSINQSDVASIEVPLPPLETQRAIVAELDEEQSAVDQAERLASKMEQRIQDAIARIWQA